MCINVYTYTLCVIMPLPTLLEKNTIEPHGLSDEDKKYVANNTAKDYIMKVVYGMYANKPKSMADKVLILVSGTGSGKSVTIAPEIYANHWKTMGRLIINTQPRQLSAIRTVQLDIMNHYSHIFKLGENLGFQTSSFARKVDKGVIFATIGTLLQQMKLMSAERFMSRYSVIIIDEAHERSVETDLTIYFIKRFLAENWENPKCPIVIFMSATINTDIFAAYFMKPRIIKVAGRAYPVVEHFAERPATNYIWAIVDKIKELHAIQADKASDGEASDDKEDPTAGKQDIIVFMSSNQPIKMLVNILHNLNEELPSDNKLYPITLTSPTYASGGPDAKALEAPLSALRIGDSIPTKKVIISTPVAETSVTIDTLKYVIDSGMRTAVEFDPVLEMNTIIIKPVSQDMAIQRKGRVGRVMAGDWYPIYDEATYKSLDTTKFPDIITNDISAAVLSLIVSATIDEAGNLTGGFNGEMPLMGGVSAASLNYAIEKLYVIGAIRAYPNGLRATPNGVVMNKFRKLPVESIAMIMAGYHYGANVLDLITIAALVNSDVVSRKYRRRKIFDNVYDAYLLADSFIDLIFLFDEFKEHCETGDIQQWCIDNAISYYSMMSAATLRDEIMEDMVFVIGLNPTYNGLRLPAVDYNLKVFLTKSLDVGIEEVRKIKASIAAGYRLNLATWDSVRRGYFTRKCPIEVANPFGEESALYFADGLDYCPPKYLIFSEATYSYYRGKPSVSLELFSTMDNFCHIDWSLC